MAAFEKCLFSPEENKIDWITSELYIRSLCLIKQHTMKLDGAFLFLVLDGDEWSA